MSNSLIDADRKLSEHFTAAMGGKAQRYEPIVSGGESSPEITVMIAAKSIQLDRRHAIDSVLAALPADTRHTLHQVYAHGTDSLSDEKDVDGKRVVDVAVGLIEDDHGRLRQALQPSWGHGSYLRLAVRNELTARKFASRHRGQEPTYGAILDFLVQEARRAADAKKGKPSSEILAKIRNACEEERRIALVEFAEAMTTGLKVAKERCEAAKKTEIRTAKVREEKAKTRPRIGRRLSDALRGLNALRAQAAQRLEEIGS